MKFAKRGTIATVSMLLAASASLVAVGPASAVGTESVGTESVETREFAPVNRPGPPLSVPKRRLAKSVRCTPDAPRAKRGVALFVHGTTVTPRENFGWNWFPAMDKLDWPYCSVKMPNNAMSDIQVSAEYVVHAIRHVYRRSGREVDVLGHSQGGNVPRFALRFWPDTRRMVDDYIGFAATNHGSLSVNTMCPPIAGCAPALWQQTLNSNYVRAMNSHQETFAGISYTNVYTRTDEFVQPNLDDTGTSSLRGGGGAITNIAIQDVCPANLTSEHIAVGTYDPTAYAIAIDALTHTGPAKPARVPGSACTQQFMPGVNPAEFPGNYASTMNTIANQLVTYPRVSAEPPLKPYVFAR
ncbi:lipase [Haloechinothrix salitolerans]|uniref:Lipase family alpha/beta hydrolase n=1 Tax=Haloechinothrix salitolerans TaxID=926830 RepID=A0ABW2BZV3_9PSEU